VSGILIGAHGHVLAVEYLSELESKLTSSKTCHKFKVGIVFRADVIRINSQVCVHKHVGAGFLFQSSQAIHSATECLGQPEACLVTLTADQGHAMYLSRPQNARICCRTTVQGAFRITVEG
jgi:hypothetical protein